MSPFTMAELMAKVQTLETGNAKKESEEGLAVSLPALCGHQGLQYTHRPHINALCGNLQLNAPQEAHLQYYLTSVIAAISPAPSLVYPTKSTMRRRPRHLPLSHLQSKHQNRQHYQNAPIAVALPVQSVAAERGILLYYAYFTSFC